MKRLAIFCLLFLIMAAASCSEPARQDALQLPNLVELKKLDVEQAVGDARKALQSGDFRLLGLRGMAIEIPGAPIKVPQEFLRLKSAYGMRILEGTTDTPANAEHQDLLQNARSYAERYNKTILTEHKIAD